MFDLTDPKQVATQPVTDKGRSLPAIRASNVIVAIPTLNEEQHIEKTIRALMRPLEWTSDCDFVVADGGSTDRTREIVQTLSAEFPNLRLIHNAERLQSAAINIVVAQAANPRHSILIRCDAHAIYPYGFVKSLAETLTANSVASVVTAMDSIGTTATARAAAWVVDTPVGSGGAAHRGGARSGYVDHGHHAAFDLDWFRKVGGYDKSFSHNEDAEYDLRLRRAGGKIWLDAGVRLAYVMRPSIRSLARQYWNYGRGRARTVVKHAIRPRLRQIAPVLNLLLLVVSAVTAIFWWPGAIWVAAYATLLLCVGLAGAVRLKSLSGFFAGPALAAMHLAWGAGFLTQLSKAMARAILRAPLTNTE